MVTCRSMNHQRPTRQRARRPDAHGVGVLPPAEGPRSTPPKVPAEGPRRGKGVRVRRGQGVSLTVVRLYTLQLKFRRNIGQRFFTGFMDSHGENINEISDNLCNPWQREKVRTLV